MTEEHTEERSEERKGVGEILRSFAAPVGVRLPLPAPPVDARSCPRCDLASLKASLASWSFQPQACVASLVPVP